MFRLWPGLLLSAWAGLGIAQLAGAQTPAAPSSASPAARPADASPVADLTPVDLPDRNRYCTPIDCVTCNNRAPGMGASVEYLFMRMRRTSNDYVIVDPTNNLNPEGAIQNVPFADTSGIRASLGYRFQNSEWGYVFTYTYLNSNDDRAAVAPPGGLLYPTLTRPGIVDAVALAGANAGVNLNVFDLETARSFQVDDSFVIRLGMGPRFANMTNTLLATYFGGDANGAVVRSRTQFDAFGLTAGLHGEWLVGRGFRFFGRARGSILMADFENSLVETNNFGATVSANVSESYRMTVPVIEMASGIAWERNNIRLAVGYELQHWFNVVNSPAFHDDFAEGNLGRRPSDLGMEGFFAQFGVVF